MSFLWKLLFFLFLLLFVLFGGTSSSAHDYSQFCTHGSLLEVLGELDGSLRCQGSNLDQPLARQVPCPLHYLYPFSWTHVINSCSCRIWPLSVFITSLLSLYCRLWGGERHLLFLQNKFYPPCLMSSYAELFLYINKTKLTHI